MTTVKIDLESLDLNLNANQTYIIEVEEGFVDSNYDNSLNDTQTFNYTVQPASTSLTLTDVNPDLGDTNVFLGIVEFVFDDRIRVDNGNFYLYKDTNPDTLVLTIPHNDSRVNVTDNKIRINVSGLLENTTTYYIVSDSNNIENMLGVSTGITNENTLKWTTGNISPAPINVVSTLTLTENVINTTLTRSFEGETENDVFSSNAPNVSGTTEIFTVRLRAYDSISNQLVQGEFAYADDSNLSSNFTITGNPSAINNILPYIKFYPSTGTSSSLKLQFTLEQNGNVVEKTYSDYTYNGLGTNQEIFTFNTTTSNYQFPLLYQKYYVGAKVLVVGGGGSGNYGFFSQNYPATPSEGSMGSGGGGGGVVESLVSVNFSNPHTFTVGAGGTPSLSQAFTIDSNAPSYVVYGQWPVAAIAGGAGGASTAFGVTAGGGGGAVFNTTYGTRTTGGTSGSPQSKAGGSGSTFGYGGGGGGAGQTGFASNGSIGTPEIRDGGDGITSTYFGGTYGGGGASKGGTYIISTNPYQEGNRSPQGGTGGGGNGPRHLAFTSIHNIASGNAGQANTGGGGAAGLEPLYDTYNGDAAPQNGGSGLIKIKLVKSLTP